MKQTTFKEKFLTDEAGAGALLESLGCKLTSFYADLRPGKLVPNIVHGTFIGGGDREFEFTASAPGYISKNAELLVRFGKIPAVPVKTEAQFKAFAAV